MKLKNIFIYISILLAFTTACSTDDLVDPNPQGQAEPAVLMIHGDQGGIETKTEVTSKAPRNLYVFVFPKGRENCLGIGHREPDTDYDLQLKESGFEAFASFVSPSPNATEVIVETRKGVKLESCQVVDVIFLYNPSTSVVDQLYQKWKGGADISLKELENIQVTLNDDVSAYKASHWIPEDDKAEEECAAGIGYSTACQRIQVELKPGMNYLGDKTMTGATTHYSKKLPLFRLLSQIELVKITNPNQLTFVLQKVYLEKGAYTNCSSLIPTSTGGYPEFKQFYDDVSESSFDLWCKAIPNLLLAVGDGENELNEAGTPSNEPLKAVLIPAGNTIATGDTHVAVFSKGNGNDNWNKGHEVSYDKLFNQNLFSFESSERSAVNLIIEGFYVDELPTSITPDDLKKYKTVKYRISIQQDELFKRGHIYKVSVPLVYSEDIKPVEINASITVAPMGTKELDFGIGD